MCLNLTRRKMTFCILFRLWPFDHYQENPRVPHHREEVNSFSEPPKNHFLSYLIDPIFTVCNINVTYTNYSYVGLARYLSPKKSVSFSPAMKEEMRIITKIITTIARIYFHHDSDFFTGFII